MNVLRIGILLFGVGGTTAYIMHHPILVMLDGTGPPINHKNPQPLPYPSSTALQSNGYLSNASFMTSPSYSSFTEVPNDIAEVYPPGHDHLL